LVSDQYVGPPVSTTNNRLDGEYGDAAKAAVKRF
jgi:hypothetical protein